MVGESSDNLPGVPGVGPKTAAKWLEMYDGLENLAAHASELKGKAAEAFQERVNDVLRNRRVNRLVCDLDLPLSLDDMERRLKVVSTSRPPGWSLESWEAGLPSTQWVSAPVSTSSVIGALGPVMSQPSH